ncbi:sigma-E processing peptidase SpoIIGA [Niallia circulans]
MAIYLDVIWLLNLLFDSLLLYLTGILLKKKSSIGEYCLEG